MNRRITTYSLDKCSDTDKLPRLARLALHETNLLGNGHPFLRIARAPAAVMAERIRRADALLSCGTNIETQAPCKLSDLDAILCGFR
jgi:hypothetical protein